MSAVLPATGSLGNFSPSSPGPSSATEERALKFLGEGHSLEITAAACGVSISRISQLLSSEDFSAAVATLRYSNLVKQSKRTEAYEELEDTILARLKQNLSLIFDPMKLARLLQVIATSKPKSSFIPSDLPSAQQTVSLTIPSIVVNQFTTNTFNQVVEINSPAASSPQTLVTIQSSALAKLSGARLGVQNASPPQISTNST
jgi:hypothetical protein